MEQERYPAQKKVWTCPKCESTSFTEDTVTMTGKTWSRFMNIQNRKFLAITCTNCQYTESVSYTHLTLPTILLV